MLRTTWLGWVSLVAGIALAPAPLGSALAHEKGKGGDHGGSSHSARSGGSSAPSQFQRGGQPSFDRSSRSQGNFSGGTRSFDGSGSSRTIEPRSLDTRNLGSRSSGSRSFDSRIVQPRSFDTRNLEPRNLGVRDLNNRVKGGDSTPRRVETLRPPTDNSSRQFHVEKPADGNPSIGGRSSGRTDSGRSVTPRNLGNNDAAADAIRKAQQRLGGSRIDSSRGPKLDSPKLDRPKFDKPSFDQPRVVTPDGRRDTLDRIKRPGDSTHDHTKPGDFSRDGRVDPSNQFKNMPRTTREALDRAKLPHDLKLGGGKTPTDTHGKHGVDSHPFDGKHRDPTDFDRDRMANDRSHHGPNFTDDHSRRDRYDLLHHRIKHDGKHDVDAATAAKWSKQTWLDKSDHAHYDRLVKNTKFEKYHLDRQYQMHHHGDVARRMDLHHDFVNHGGWQHRNVGHVSSQYRNFCSYRNYWGPSWYPQRCWYPNWNRWVSWSWGFNCNPWYDPRPSFCRPIIYNPCPRWVFWQYPVWQPLPVVAAGTWVDVPQVIVQQGWDVRLLAVRFVDPGHLEQRLGQRYRVWIRNDSNRDIDRPFNVVMMGTNDLVPGDRRLEVGQRVPSIAAGQTLAIDMRLPLSPDGGGEPMPFEKLHLLVDANRELNDVEMTNNGAVVDREEIMPVDPAAFNVDADVAAAGEVITIAGEGLGPEPGQILLQVGNETYQPEILGWYDLGVQIRLPAVNAAGMTDGDLVVVRGDGAATNPLAIQIAGAGGGREF